MLFHFASDGIGTVIVESTLQKVCLYCCLVAYGVGDTTGMDLEIFLKVFFFIFNTFTNKCGYNINCIEYRQYY